MEIKINEDNINIIIYSAFNKNPIINIILLKKNILDKNDEDDDYWDFIINKIKDIKLFDNDLDKLVNYIGKKKFNECKIVEIYYEEDKNKIIKEINDKNECYILFQERYYPINLIKLRENNDLYNKFVKHYMYYLNFGSDYHFTYNYSYQASRWFLWFYKNFYQEYELPVKKPDKKDIKIKLDDSIYIDNEPQIDYDDIFQEYIKKADLFFY
jgi:hypothetical protein